jgi:hypothetical protein
VRGGKRARQQEASVKAPSPSLEFGVLAIKDVGRLRWRLAEQEQITAFDFLGTDGPEPFAPVWRHDEALIGKHPMVRRHVPERHRVIEFYGKHDYGVLVAVIDPERGIALLRLSGHWRP